jgi:hypothetical protein
LLTVVVWRGATFVETQGGRQRLDVDGAFDLRLASNGDVAILVAQSGRSDLGVFRSIGGGPFVPTEFVVSADPLERRISGVWATTHGFFTFQHTRRLLPHVSRSVDGSRWETISAPAFEMPGDIYAMAQLPSRDILAVGVLRSGATGSFRAAMWRSSDGITWEPVPTVGELTGASSFGSVATQGETVILAGKRFGRPTLWRSDDGGTSWVIVDDRARGEQTVAAINGGFVRIGIPLPVEVADIAFATSIDGRDWQDGIASGLLDDGLTLFARQIATTTSGVFIMGSTQLDLSRRLDWCYSDLAACVTGSGSVVVLHTANGDVWRAIDVDSLLGPGFKALAVTDTRVGTVIAGAVRGGVEIITVPPASWSFVSPASIPRPRQLAPLATANGPLEVGVIYRYPLRVHCGLEWLGEFNGRRWKLLRQVIGTPESPRPLRALPQIEETLLGTIRLTSPDTIEYSVDGIGVVAIYGPTELETASACL